MNEELKAYASELVADGALSGTIRTDELTALLSRLEQAEQQVARVRSVCELDAYEVSNEFGDYDAVAVENILDALDGESNE